MKKYSEKKEEVIKLRYLQKSTVLAITLLEKDIKNLTKRKNKMEKELMRVKKKIIKLADGK